MPKDTAAIIAPQTPYDAILELFTANCNLRCLYCGIQTDKEDLPDYPRQQMPREVIDYSRQLFARDRPRSINLCGNGETTMLEDWTTICEPFLSFDNVAIISNLAKVLSWEEASFLSRFNYLMTSIDTADAELLREIRRPAELRDIVMNINLVRTAAVVRGHRPPIIAINCEVTTKNYRELSGSLRWRQL
jgi:wyosine [tRNA(Phe)-imidazoG37] synthetase (radical SAM superfamily)